MVKTFITFYLIQYNQNAFHDGLFVSLYSILQMELYFPSLVENHQISALGCLESVANKKRHVPSKKKQLVKKNSTRKINFQLAKFSTFQNYKFLITTRKAALQLVNLFF